MTFANDRRRSVPIENNPGNFPGNIKRREVTRSWRTMIRGAHPWERVAFRYNGRTEINALMNAKDIAAGKAKVGYTMTLNSEGAQPVNKMKSQCSALEHGFKTFE